MRRATASFNAAQPATQNFYPRSPCGERPLCCRSQARPFSISIHALLAESDLRAEGPKKARYKFLSTLSLRRATATPRAGRQAAAISIHALLAESDAILGNPCAGCPAISIHALLAESDRRAHVAAEARSQFLSTLSLRRATAVPWAHPWACAISIHALLAESDCVTCTRCGIAAPISIHALLAESDASNGCSICGMESISIHALLAESDRGYFKVHSPPKKISIHALLAESDTPAGKVRPWASHISIHALLAESD